MPAAAKFPSGVKRRQVNLFRVVSIRMEAVAYVKAVEQRF
jgi:hypothetical protein